MDRLDLNTPSNINGLLFGVDGKITAFTICTNKMMQVICHGLSDHFVTTKGGFHAGTNTFATKGVAIGNGAISDENNTGIDSIQLGGGINNDEKSLKVYDFKLLNSDGKIPTDRLPNLTIEMEIIDNVLSWRYVGDTVWTALLDVSNLNGEDGQAFQVNEYGNLNEAKLVEIANNITTGRYLFLVNPSGDIRADNTTPASLNGDMSRHILMYDGDSQEWFDYGEFTGLQGDPGTPIELQNNGTYIQWKYTTDATWTNLITLANLKGDKGDKGEDGANGLNLELDGTDVNYIRWRVVGDSTWINLVNKSTLIGATGDKGEDGTPAKVIKLVPSSTVFKDSNKDVALSFNSSSDYVKLSSVNALNNILNGAKQVRINCGITPENNSSDYGMIFCIVEVGISIRVENGYIYVNSRALKQAGAYGLNVAPFTKGVYYDIDVTFDYENSEVVVIINNTTYTESINFESSTYQGNTLTQSYVYLGNHQVAGRAFKGKIHYLTIEKDNVEVLNMPMNEGTGSIIYDKRNGNNGTINGATWVNTVTTAPTTINVSGLSQGTTISNWQYSLNGGTYSNTAPFGVNRTNNNVEILGKSLEANTISIKAYNGDVSDIVTISKYKDGEDGIDGAKGAKGDDGDDGTEVEFRVYNNIWLQWRYVGAASWNNSYDLRLLDIANNNWTLNTGILSPTTPTARIRTAVAAVGDDDVLNKKFFDDNKSTSKGDEFNLNVSDGSGDFQESGLLLEDFAISNAVTPSNTIYVGDNNIEITSELGITLITDSPQLVSGFVPTLDDHISNKKYVDDSIPDITGKADKTNVLELDNTTEFTPDGDYEPATKKYVDDKKLTTNVTSSASITSTGNAPENELFVTALVEATTLNEPSGTPVNGNTLIMRIYSAAAQALTWNAIYKPFFEALPTTTTAGKEMYLAFIYNSRTSKWDYVGKTVEI